MGWFGCRPLLLVHRGRYDADAAAYDPDTDSWRLIAEASIEARESVATVWDGRRMIVAGDERFDGPPECPDRETCLAQGQVGAPTSQAMLDGADIVTVHAVGGSDTVLMVLGVRPFDSTQSVPDPALFVAYRGEFSTCALPDVEGLTLGEARRITEAEGFVLSAHETDPQGDDAIVRTQEPPGGTQALGFAPESASAPTPPPDPARSGNEVCASTRIFRNQNGQSKVPWRPSPDAKRAAPSLVSPLAMTVRPSSVSRRRAASASRDHWS